MKKKVDPEINDKYDSSIEESNGFSYSQASNVSSISRNLVMGIVATVWVVSYIDGEFILPNKCLVSAMAIAFVYLLVDVIHYYSDARFYHKGTLSLEKHYGNPSFLKKDYNDSMIAHAKKSQSWFVGKFYLFLLTAVIFLVGMFVEFLPML